MNTPENNESDIHSIHNGKFYFSIFDGGRHLSWCDLKILQGKNNHTLVFLSQPQGYIGTFIANAAEDIATQVTNLFGLDPATTMYIHYTPPTVPLEYKGFEDDPLAKIVRSLSGPSSLSERTRQKSRQLLQRSASTTAKTDATQGSTVAGRIPSVMIGHLGRKHATTLTLGPE